MYEKRLLDKLLKEYITELPAMSKAVGKSRNLYAVSQNRI